MVSFAFWKLYVNADEGYLLVRWCLVWFRGIMSKDRLWAEVMTDNFAGLQEVMVPILSFFEFPFGALRVFAHNLKIHQSTSPKMTLSASSIHPDDAVLLILHHCWMREDIKNISLSHPLLVNNASESIRMMATSYCLGSNRPYVVPSRRLEIQCCAEHDVSAKKCSDFECPIDWIQGNVGMLRSGLVASNDLKEKSTTLLIQV